MYICSVNVKKGIEAQQIVLVIVKMIQAKQSGILIEMLKHRKLCIIFIVGIDDSCVLAPYPSQTQTQTHSSFDLNPATYIVSMSKKVMKHNKSS